MLALSSLPVQQCICAYLQDNSLAFKTEKKFSIFSCNGAMEGGERENENKWRINGEKNGKRK